MHSSILGCSSCWHLTLQSQANTNSNQDQKLSDSHGATKYLQKKGSMEIPEITFGKAGGVLLICQSRIKAGSSS